MLIPLHVTISYPLVIYTIFIYNLEKYFGTIMHVVSKHHTPYTNIKLIF